MQRFSFKLNILAGIISSLLAGQAFSSAVRNDVDYQYFRDFAENKGKFFVGASNVPIYDNLNRSIAMMLRNVPMIDFSPVDRSGVSTLIHPQYIASVAHNSGYSSVSFGEAGNNPDAHHFSYLLVDRNDYPQGQKLDKDYHIPRLSKLVTEVSPSAVTSAGPEGKAYSRDKVRFPMFLRIGSGTQYTRNTNRKNTYVAGPYQFLTAGVPVSVTGGRRDWIDAGSWIFGNEHGSLVTYATGGDSGSPLFGYDTTENRWVMVGVLNFNNGDENRANTFAINRPDYILQKQQEDIGAQIQITNQAENFIWMISTTANNSSTLTSAQQSINVDIFDSNVATAEKHKPRLNHGKSLYFSGETGTLNLADNINQGAGALYFDANFTVSGNNENTTWQGAGISVAENKQVTWKLHNPENDRLSKIGKGTLYVSGKGKNKGDISVGEGTVILDQQANENGEKQAFNQVGIVSGRSTVVLNDAQQVDPDKIYFGFRGGRLDLNGNDLTFTYIQNTDDGARIVNHNLTKTANVTITNQRLPTRDELTVKDRVHPNQHFYSWDKADNNPNTYDYFLPKKGSSDPYYPTNQQSNDNWEYIGSDLEKAKDTVLERLNQKKLISAFNGYFGETDNAKNNGKLNLTFSPETNQHLFFVTGGLELNGDVNVTKGNLLLSGRPTPHAYDHLKGKDVIIDDDWINRTFNATTINVTNDATLFIGRNVKEVNASFTASQNAKLNLGFLQNKTPECIRSDYTGIVKCEVKDLSEQVLNSSPISVINGNVQLNGNSQLNLSRATLTGSIQGEQTSHITLYKDSQWILNNNSIVGNLTLNEGSKVILNHQSAVANEQYHTLTINGDLSGNGYFQFLTNISRQLGDGIIVNGRASGTHQFFIANSGEEPRRALTLLTLNGNGNQTNQDQFSVALANTNQSVDLGAFRYQLVKESNRYVLAIADQQTQNGKGVTAEALPEAHFQNGAGVTAAPLPEVHFQNGAGVTADPLPEAHFQNGAGVTAESLPEVHFQNGKGVTADPLPEVHFKSENITVDPLPTAYPDDILSNDNGIPVVKQNRIISRYSNGGLSEISAQVNALLQINANLHQVMSAKSEHALNVWATTEQQKTTHSSDNYRAYRQQINLTQVGVEKGLDNKFRLGAVLSNGHTSGDFDDNISQKGRFTQVSVYGKKTWNNGLFASLEASYGKARNSLNHQQKSEFSRDIVTTGLTLGTHWDLFNWEVSPTLAVRYHRLSEVNYNFDGANIKVNPLNLFTYQAGLSVGRDFKFGSFQLRPELSSQYIDASHNNTNVEVNGHKLHQEFGRYVRNQFGLSLKQSNWELTLSGGLQQGNEVKKQRIAALKFAYYM